MAISTKRQGKLPKERVSNTELELMPINPEIVRQYITANRMGSKILCFDELESTNFSAKELAKVGYPDGTVVLCEKQLCGRGRQDKKWISEPSKNVCMSIILRPELEPRYAPRYTVAAALAVSNVLASYCIHDITIKWPNDIIINHKKICGILMESCLSAGELSYLVVGIGLNVNTQRFYGDIEDIATSINQLLGIPVSRNRVVASILNSAESYFDRCKDIDSFRELQREYNQLSAVLNKEVKIVKEEAVYSGTAVGFDDIGRIIIKNGEELMKFDSGEVSLRYNF